MLPSSLVDTAKLYTKECEHSAFALPAEKKVSHNSFSYTASKGGVLVINDYVERDANQTLRSTIDTLKSRLASSKFYEAQLTYYGSGKEEFSRFQDRAVKCYPENQNANRELDSIRQQVEASALKAENVLQGISKDNPLIIFARSHNSSLPYGKTTINTQIAPYLWTQLVQHRPTNRAFNANYIWLKDTRGRDEVCSHGSLLIHDGKVYTKEPQKSSYCIKVRDMHHDFPRDLTVIAEVGHQALKVYKAQGNARDLVKEVFPNITIREGQVRPGQGDRTMGGNLGFGDTRQ